MNFRIDRKTFSASEFAIHNDIFSLRILFFGNEAFQDEGNDQNTCLSHASLCLSLQ